MFNESRMKKKIERLIRRNEELQESNEKLIAENEKLKQNEELVNEKIEEFNRLISSLKESKIAYDDAMREIRLEREKYKKDVKEFIGMIKPKI